MLLVVEHLIAWLERVPDSCFPYVMNGKLTFGVSLDRTLLSDSSSVKASTFYHRKPFLSNRKFALSLSKLAQKRGFSLNPWSKLISSI